jgi:hypothetical protein
MSYEGRVYRILIASPSDVDEERETAVGVIQQWNDLNSYNRHVVLLPLRWETHTAPEYGTRPQEVINRAIVDQCDLLIGMFWTRIGTRTEDAESGTLEEIERVAEVGKPVMLYFSQREIEPDRIDLKQLTRLRKFKEKTYSGALVESYKSLNEFRDKLAKQLEMKVRELQHADTAGPVTPLELQFIALDSKLSVGNSLATYVDLPQISDLDEALASVDDGELRARIRGVAEARVNKTASFPLLLGINNTGSSGVRNIYVEMSLRAVRGRVSISPLETGDGSITFSTKPDLNDRARFVS